MVAALTAIAALSPLKARAQFTLTPAAQNAGWTMSAFATGFAYSNNGAGPLGIAFEDNGAVILSDAMQYMYVLPNDKDGQTAQSSVNYSGGHCGLARVGSHFYMAQQGNNSIVEINPKDGTVEQAIVTGVSHATGLAANPSNGHLLVTSYDHTWIGDVDPVAKKASVLFSLPPGNSGAPNGFSGADGIATDGITIYVMAYETVANGSWRTNGHILGFRLSDHTETFDSGYIYGADGIAIGSGSLAGYLYVNTNYGELFQIDIASQSATVLATGGHRGDFVAVDPNGSILVTQPAWVARLTPPSGASFETAGVSVSPSTVVGGNQAQGTVTLSAPAPVTMSVALSASSGVTAPKSIMVAAGATTATFAVSTSPVSATSTCTVSATLNGITENATFNVRPPGVKAFTLSAGTVKGGSQVTATVTLEGPAPSTGARVTFTSSNTGAVPTPGAVMVSAGQTTVTFQVKTSAVTSNQTVTLSATANSRPAVNTTLVVTP